MRPRLARSLSLGLLLAALVAPGAQAAPTPLTMRDVHLGAVAGMETFSITATNRSSEPQYFSSVSLSGFGDIAGWVQDPALVNECVNLMDLRRPPYLEPGQSCTAQFRVQPVAGYRRIDMKYCIGGWDNRPETCATIRGQTPSA